MKPILFISRKRKEKKRKEKKGKSDFIDSD